MHVESEAESSEYGSETDVEEYKTTDDLIEMLLARAEAKIAANLAKNNGQQMMQSNPTIESTTSQAAQTNNAAAPIETNDEVGDQRRDPTS